MIMSRLSAAFIAFKGRDAASPLPVMDEAWLEVLSCTNWATRLNKQSLNTSSCVFRGDSILFSKESRGDHVGTGYGRMGKYRNISRGSFVAAARSAKARRVLDNGVLERVFRMDLTGPCVSARLLDEAGPALLNKELIGARSRPRR